MIASACTADPSPSQVMETSHSNDSFDAITRWPYPRVLFRTLCSDMRDFGAVHRSNTSILGRIACIRDGRTAIASDNMQVRLRNSSARYDDLGLHLLLARVCI